jgi:hypothetical protein
MVNQENAYKKELGYKWIKAESSGISYLCPAKDVADVENPTESYLQAVCVDESTNPQNS